MAVLASRGAADEARRALPAQESRDVADSTAKAPRQHPRTLPYDVGELRIASVGLGQNLAGNLKDAHNGALRSGKPAPLTLETTLPVLCSAT